MEVSNKEKSSHDGEEKDDDMEIEDKDLENRDRDDMSGELLSNEDISLFTSQCRLAFSDVQLSSELVEKGIEDNDLEIVKQELTDIEKACNNFDIAYTKILELCSKIKFDMKEHNDRRKRFLLLVKGLKVKISKFTIKDAPADSLSRVKYAKIDIASFNGDKNDWPRFKAAFSTYYHETNMQDLEKHTVLFNKTTAEANELIRGFTLNGKHYEDAWNTLLDHYDDPLKTVSRHLDALSRTPAVGQSDGKEKKKQTLRSLITKFRPNVTAIEITFKENASIDPTSQFLIHQFLQKADKGTRLEWEREVERRKSFATFKEFIGFMESRCNAYERASLDNSAAGSSNQKVCTVKSQLYVKCYCCSSQNHYLHRCPKFLEMSPENRSLLIRKRKLCAKCFKGKCDRSCPFTCKKCNGKHNTLVHLANPPPRKGPQQPTAENGELFCSFNNLENTNNFSKIFKLVPDGWIGSIATDSLNALLATAIIQITNSRGNNVCGRALLDSGSHPNLITGELARKIDSPINNSYSTFNSVNQLTFSANKLINVNLKSRFSNFELKNLECVIVDEIIDQIPNEYFPTDNWNFPKYLSMADPEFNIPAPVDLLLGASVFWKILKPNFYDIGKGIPRLFATQFGWLVAGDVDFEKCEISNSNYILFASQTNNNNNLSKTIEKLWILEEPNNSNWTLEELECENHFLKHTFRNVRGQFVVKLPFKIPPENLGNSKFQALKRFYSLERKMAKNSKYKMLYVTYMLDLIKQGHMREVTEYSYEHSIYIPHHGVIKEGSTSTPLRPVFDASMPTNSGLSINDCLMVGPTVQSDLVSIMLRSRVHIVVFSADIKQMYRRVLVNENDYCYQGIFWRENSEDKLKTFELTTVIFGLTSAPFLATRCLKKLADDEGNNFPAAKNALLNDFYIDDVFTGADSIEEALKIKQQLVQILNGASFELTKWCSNSKELLREIPAEKLEQNFPLYNDKEFAIKTLGLIWLPEEDNFRVWVNLKKIENYTKREILSAVASVFDPLGFLSPVTIVAKLIMQSLWVKPSKNSLGWDSEIPDDIKIEWLNFSENLSSLNTLSIHRPLFVKKRSKIIELHCFADASTRAYGAVIYIRGIDSNDVITTLFCSKTKVAPLKKQSLARLELCAALLLAELLNKVLNSLNGVLNFDIIRLWSDSEIALTWLRSSSKRWQIFVANRVEKIQRLSKNAYWDYVNTETNPADLVSRGISPELLANCTFWWKGPEWLSNSIIPFNTEIKFKPKNKNQDLEMRHSKRVIFTATVVKRSDFFSKFSDFTKLIRVTAWCLRFIWNFHWYGPFLRGPLQYFELNQATNILIKLVQQEYFSAEIKDLKRGKMILPKNRISGLTPFLDALDIIRVGGRLRNSEFSYEQCFPILLPSQHPFTELLVSYEHKKHLHAGPNLLRSVLRRKYWILQQNKIIQSCILKCVQCIRQKADTRTQLMASLPKARVTPARAFQTTGIDYAGPFKLIGKGGRHRVIIQCYIGIFVCFATKAMHLELISDLTTETFLAAFTRFSSRRGLPSNVYSDNGTTFQGAKNKLKELTEFFNKNGDLISQQILNNGCQWHFIPPYAPHFGGLWEAGVKSVKTHLKPVLGSSLFTYEQYETILTQIEACLNSRPLTVESNDPNECSALTPGHFLIGGPITALPNPDFTQIPLNKLKYWEMTKRKATEFWKRWSKEYLHTLQQKTKWKQVKNDFKVGDIVIIKEENSPPTHWPLGKITATHPGSDGLVRVVTVKQRVGSFENVKKSKGIAKTTEIKRPISKLIYLPTEVEQ